MVYTDGQVIGKGSDGSCSKEKVKLSTISVV